MRHSPTRIVCLACLAPWLPEAAADIEDRLPDRWYAIEVIVLQRSGVTETNSIEHLSHIEQRRFPAAIASIANRPAGAGYRLNPLTLATLEFPTLAFDCAAAADAAEAEPDRPMGVPAWYQPAAPDLPSEPWNPDLATTASPIACIPTEPGAGYLPDNLGDACPPMPLDMPLTPGRPKALCAKAAGVPAPPIEPVLEAHPLLDWLRALRRFEREMQAGSYRPVTDGARLNREAGRIRSAGGLQVLWHGRWTQPLPSRAMSAPLLIQAGPQSELQGTFDITLGTYLHFHARLWFHAPGPAGLAATAVQPTSGAAEQLPLDAAAAPPQLATPDSYMVLEERRVMRKGTLHYLDHPHLGILVRADPVQPPNWLVDASAALEAAEFVD